MKPRYRIVGNDVVGYHIEVKFFWLFWSACSGLFGGRFEFKTFEEAKQRVDWWRSREDAVVTKVEV